MPKPKIPYGKWYRDWLKEQEAQTRASDRRRQIRLYMQAVHPDIPVPYDFKVRNDTATGRPRFITWLYYVREPKRHWQSCSVKATMALPIPHWDFNPAILEANHA